MFMFGGKFTQEIFWRIKVKVVAQVEVLPKASFAFQVRTTIALILPEAQSLSSKTSE